MSFFWERSYICKRKGTWWQGLGGNMGVSIQLNNSHRHLTSQRIQAGGEEDQERGGDAEQQQQDPQSSPLSTHCFVQGHGWGGPRPASDQNSGDKEECTERRLRWRKDGEKQILSCSYSLLKRPPEERKVCTRLSKKNQWEPEMSQGVMEFTLPMDSHSRCSFTLFQRSLSTAWWGARQVGIIPILLISTLRHKKLDDLPKVT